MPVRENFANDLRKKHPGLIEMEALRETAGQCLLRTDMTVKEYRDLTRRICGVDDLRFCRDVGKLERFLSALKENED